MAADDWYDRDGNRVGYDRYRELSDAATARGEDYRRIAYTDVPEADANVSTVHLGLNHAWGEGAAPLIFESMVFGGGLDQTCERYSTEAEARAGHEAVVDKVRQEAEALAELAADPDVAAAVRLLTNRMGAHVARFGYEDYDGRVYARLARAVTK